MKIKRLFLILVALCMTLMLFSCSKSPTFSRPQKEIEIRAKRFSYTPNTIKVDKGDIVVLRLISEDVTHGFYLDGYGVEFFVPPGESRTVNFKADKAGRFTFRCSKTCGELHPYMIGSLYVEPNYRFAFSGLGLLLIGGLFVTLVFRGKINDKILGVFNPEAKFELTKYKWVRSMLKSRWMPLIPLLVNLFIFTIIFIAGWIGGEGAGNYNFGIMIVWIIWWVMLMLVLVPIFARLWCTMCPLPLLGDWLQRLKIFGVRTKKLLGLNKRWPRSLRNMWLVNIIFLSMTFFTAFFTTRPIYTFVLLALIVVVDVIVSYVYEKRTFCRYLCPIGGFQGLYSNFSLTEVRVKDPEICKDHKPKTCVLGDECGYGCPWMEVPYKMNRNTYCGLCFECFKSCPHDNMALNIRHAGTDLLVDEKRGLDEAWKSFIMIGCAVLFYLIMQGPWGNARDWANMKTTEGFLTYAGLSSSFSLLILPAFFGLFVWMSRIAAGASEISYKKIYTDLSYSLTPIGLAAWMAFSVGILFANSSYILHVLSDPFALGWNLFGTAHTPWTPFLTGLIPYLQIVAVVAGLVYGLDYGYKLAKQVYKEREKIAKGFAPLAGFLVLMSIAFLWLFVG